MATWNSPDYAELVEDRILTDNEHFIDVKKAVVKLLSRWQFVANVLGVQSMIGEANTPIQREKFMDDDIHTWLQRAYNVQKYGPPTWKKLVQAIADRIGGNNPAYAMEFARAHPKIGAQHQATHLNIAEYGHGTTVDAPPQSTIAGDGAESLLKTVTYELNSVAHKYCELGVQLGMPLHQIKSLEDRYRYTSGVERMLAEIIEWWLRENGGSRDKLWTTIIESLKVMGENRLAIELHDKYNI